jgi:hypothetical protein
MLIFETFPVISHESVAELPARMLSGAENLMDVVAVTTLSADGGALLAGTDACRCAAGFAATTAGATEIWMERETERKRPFPVKVYLVLLVGETTRDPLLGRSVPGAGERVTSPFFTDQVRVAD